MFFWNFSVANMADIEHNANFKQWFNVFLVISEAWQGYESKAYGILNHNLRLQCKKFSRTRDIWNFPTQGWADTTFCTRNWSETYMFERQAAGFLHAVKNGRRSVLFHSFISPHKVTSFSIGIGEDGSTNHGALVCRVFSISWVDTGSYFSQIGKDWNSQIEWF